MVSLSLGGVGRLGQLNVAYVSRCKGFQIPPGLLQGNGLVRSIAPISIGSSTFLQRSFASSLKPVIKDPDMPTRPATPWIRFLNDFRQQQGSGLKPKEVMTKASASWKTQSDSDKKKYEEPYELEKQTYQEKLKAYVESGKKDAWRRDPARPKAPITGFLRFVQEFRKTRSDMKMTEQTKLAAASWKGMDAAKRLPYEQAYAVEKEQYTKDLKAYQDSGKEDAWKQKTGIASKEAKLKAKQEKEEAKKKAMKETTEAKKKAAKEKEEQKKQKAKEKAQKDKEKKKAAKLKAGLKKKKTGAKATPKTSKK